MARYSLELPYVIEGCFDCPMFTGQRECRAMDYRQNWDHADVRPDWCPMMPIEEYEVKEWIEGVNSQTFKDEGLVTIRVGLYESEQAKLGGLSAVNKLSVSQQVAALIEAEWERINGQKTV